MHQILKSTLIIALISSASISTFATASDAGAFIEVSAGYSSVDLPAIAGTTQDDNSTAFSIGGGYRFNKMIAAEVGYTDLGEASYSVAGTTIATADAKGWYAGPRLTFAVTDKLDAYARAGVFFWEAEASALGITVSDDGSDAYYGLGAAWNFTDKVSAGLDWTRYDTDSEIDVISAKLKFNF